MQVSLRRVQSGHGNFILARARDALRARSGCARALSACLQQHDEGTGAAVLGSPAISCAWLANKLLEFGVSLEPGDVVISGALMKMIPFTAGDRFVFDLAGQPGLAVTIA